MPVGDQISKKILELQELLLFMGGSDPFGRPGSLSAVESRMSAEMRVFGRIGKSYLPR